MDAEKRDFHLKEYECLRAEVLAANATLFQATQIATAASAAVYAFLLIYKSQGAIHLGPAYLATASFLPLSFTITGVVLSHGTLNGIKRIAEYLYRLEAAMGQNNGLGWETFLVHEKEDYRRRWLGWNGPWREFWILLALLNLCGGCVMAWYALYPYTKSLPMT